MSIEGQGHFFTIYFPGFVCMFCALLTSRYQVSVYRTNGPLVYGLKDENVSNYWNIICVMKITRYLVKNDISKRCVPL